jgi:hypothetical protein
MADQYQNQTSFSKQPPSSFRYLKARLRILKRPALWGSAAVLLLGLIVFFEYWQHSGKLGLTVSRRPSRTGVASLDSLPNNPSAPTLPSQEDSAIGADIDTLPLLLSELNSPLPAAENDENQQNQNQESSTQNSGSDGTQAGINENTNPGSTNSFALPSFSLFSSRAPQQNRASISRNPFVSSTQTLASVTPPNLNFNLLPGMSAVPNLSSPTPLATTSSGSNILNTSPNSLPGQNSSTATVNPLEQAIQRYSTPTNANNPGISNPVQSGSSFNAQQPLMEQPGSIVPTQPGQGLLVQPAPIPTSPPMGSTGYTLPSTLQPIPYGAPGTSTTGRSSYVDSFRPRTTTLPAAPQLAPNTIPLQPGNYSGQPSFSNPSVVNPGINGTSPTVPTYTTPSAQPDASFSVPNQVPGRYIGNGEIDTFGNP